MRKKELMRPKCLNIGCDRPVEQRDTKKSGNPSLKPHCWKCYEFRNNPAKLLLEGITVVKKNYCENCDGRLGFPCTASGLLPYQLHIDHLDGDVTNNTPENTQTICANCHGRKTVENKDCDSTRANLVA